MPMQGLVLALCLMFAVCVSALAQTTRRVPSNYLSIQAAIDAAANGDTVLVAPGTYVENINFNGKAVTVRSERGANDTAIDGNGAGSVVIFANGEGPSSRLTGFTIRNGTYSPWGGGIHVSGASPTITENIIVNSANSSAGIWVLGGSPLIRRNAISGNSAAGIDLQGPGSAQVLDNVIAGNALGGIWMIDAGTPLVKGNIISENTASVGGGIGIINESSPSIVQNLIVGNSAPFGGGGIIWSVPPGVPGPLLVNNTIADNDSPDGGSGIHADGDDGGVRLINNVIVAKPGQTAIHCAGNGLNIDTPVLQFNNVYVQGAAAYGGICTNITGTAGNISAAPVFAGSSSLDYRLTAGSPGIDKGVNSVSGLPSTDLLGSARIRDGDGNGVATVDMGAYEFTSASRALTVSSSSGDFGTFIAGAASATRVATISNAGTGPVTVVLTAVASSEPASFALSTGGPAPCASLTPTLASKISCTIQLTFTPNTSGAKKALLVVMADAIGSPALATFSATVLEGDTTPDPFAFTPQVNVGISSTVTSNSITISGITAPAAISIADGTYSIDGGPFTASPGTIRNGQSVVVRLIAPATYASTLTAILTIGGAVAGFNVTTGLQVINAAPYFPLFPGSSWTVSRNGAAGHTVTATDALAINGVSTTGLSDSSDGTINYFSNDAGGVRLHRVYWPPSAIAGCGVVAETDTYGPPVTIIPENGTIGQTITSTGTVTADVGACGVFRFAYVATSTLESMEQVIVPAGQFVALKVRVTMSVQGVSSVSTLWLIPGIGEVKSVSDDGTVDQLVSVRIAYPVPAAPTRVTATAGPASITVKFSPPAKNDGPEVTGYTATCTSSNGGISRSITAGAGATSIQVGGLTNGRSYVCTVTASNAGGTGPASAPSVAIRPFDITPILNLLMND